MLTSPPTISKRIAVKPNRDGTVIAKVNFHVSAENSAGNGKPIVSKGVLETLNKRFRNYWRGGICKAGTAATARIGIEGKLRDNQSFSTNIEQRAVHLALIVFKNAQMDDFIGQGFYLISVIAIPYPQKYQESMIYLADDLFIHCDTGAGDAL